MSEDYSSMVSTATVSAEVQQLVLTYDTTVVLGRNWQCVCVFL